VGSPWRRGVEEKWARVLFRTQSGVELRLYVKCRGGEEVCEKRGPISWLKPSSLYRHLLTTLTLVTHHLALHKAL